MNVLYSSGYRYGVPQQNSYLSLSELKGVNAKQNSSCCIIAFFIPFVKLVLPFGHSPRVSF